MKSTSQIIEILVWVFLLLWVKNLETSPLSFSVESQPERDVLCAGRELGFFNSHSGSSVHLRGSCTQGLPHLQSQLSDMHAFFRRPRIIIAALSSITLSLENKHISIFLSLMLPKHYAWGQFMLPEPGIFYKGLLTGSWWDLRIAFQCHFCQ